VGALGAGASGRGGSLNVPSVGIVNIPVGFAPLKPAELVGIRIQQMVGPVAV